MRVSVGAEAPFILKLSKSCVVAPAVLLIVIGLFIATPFVVMVLVPLVATKFIALVLVATTVDVPITKLPNKLIVADVSSDQVPAKPVQVKVVSSIPVPVAKITVSVPDVKFKVPPSVC